MSDTPLKITFTQKASSEDSVEFSFSAVVTDPESVGDALDPSEAVSAVCGSVYKAVQEAVLDRCKQLLGAQEQALSDRT